MVVDMQIEPEAVRVQSDRLIEVGNGEDDRHQSTGAAHSTFRPSATAAVVLRSRRS
jgi:hypothetical protein